MDQRDPTLDEILGHAAWIRGVARRLVTDEAERDDVVQEVWVEALRKQSRARAVRPWLFGVVRNVARSELRRDSDRRAREEASDPAAEAARPDELVERVELERQVASALLELGEPYRSTLLLRYYEDLSPTEIARPIGIGSTPAFSDDDGNFELDAVPAGDVYVWCFPPTQFWSDGRAELTVTSGQDGNCVVPVVKVDPNAPMRPLGTSILPSVMPATFGPVDPGGPASRAGIRAGDLLLTVDGADITKLTPMGVLFLINQYPLGATIHLGLSRAAQAVAANFVVAN